MNFQNMMHIVVTAIVVFTTITSGFVLALGYLKKEKIRSLGKLILIMSTIITFYYTFNKMEKLDFIV
ncbi:MAG: hypothetical protein ABRQ27_04375 [Clostridiaceae bacterium]